MLLPGAGAAICCPWCGLQTRGGDSCDMCRRPLRPGGTVHAANFAYVAPDRSVDWARILGPAAIIACLVFGAVGLARVVNLGRSANAPRTLPPIKSSRELPAGVKEIAAPMQGYADMVKRADAATTPEDDSLRREKDMLLASAQSRIAQGGQLAGPATSVSAPAQPERASVSGTVIPAGETYLNSAATQNAPYIESADAFSRPRFEGSIVIVNPTDREVETFDLTLQVGDQFFPISLSGQAADASARGIAPKSAVEVRGKVEPVGPVAGPARLVLRVLYFDSNEPALTTFVLR